MITATHASTAPTEVKGYAEVMVPLSPEKSKNQSDKGTASSVITLILCIHAPIRPT
ncbi:MULTISPECIES: hypothetical protein [unclassified Paenibacillus]|uniref:hypothetical protein n=1 Tax=unclassified Paenibacillus TaxID=185978 RepID=UPI003627A5E9